MSIAMKLFVVTSSSTFFAIQGEALNPPTKSAPTPVPTIPCCAPGYYRDALSGKCLNAKPSKQPPTKAPTNQPTVACCAPGYYRSDVNGKCKRVPVPTSCPTPVPTPKCPPVPPFRPPTTCPPTKSSQSACGTGYFCDVKACGISNSVTLFNQTYPFDTTMLSIDAPIGSTIPRSIVRFTNLRVLSLHHVMGEIPSELGMITTLRSLDLNSNFLTGSLPSELGALTMLTFLTMNNNRFLGQIPTEWTRLTAFDCPLHRTHLDYWDDFH